MNVRFSILFLYSVLIGVPPSFTQGRSPEESPQPQLLAQGSDKDLLKGELHRIETEINQVAQNMKATDARMMQ